MGSGHRHHCRLRPGTVDLEVTFAFMTRPICSMHAGDRNGAVFICGNWWSEALIDSIGINREADAVTLVRRRVGVCPRPFQRAPFLFYHV